MRQTAVLDGCNPVKIWNLAVKTMMGDEQKLGSDDGTLAEHIGMKSLVSLQLQRFR